jgi:hypothetical protein
MYAFACSSGAVDRGAHLADIVDDVPLGVVFGKVETLAIVMCNLLEAQLIRPDIELDHRSTHIAPLLICFEVLLQTLQALLGHDLEPHKDAVLLIGSYAMYERTVAPKQMADARQDALLKREWLRFEAVSILTLRMSRNC